MSDTEAVFRAIVVVCSVLIIILSVIDLVDKWKKYFGKNGDSK